MVAFWVKIPVSLAGLLPPIATVNMKVICSYEMLVTTYKPITRTPQFTFSPP
jgi:hypothetical protein